MYLSVRKPWLLLYENLAKQGDGMQLDKLIR